MVDIGVVLVESTVTRQRSKKEQKGIKAAPFFAPRGKETKRERDRERERESQATGISLCCYWSTFLFWSIGPAN
jgi:hypothetical protein